MNYLEYLPETRYQDLPLDVQSGIGREEYEHLRSLAASMEAPPALPPSLAAALAAKVGSSTNLASQSAIHPPAFWQPLAIGSSLLSLVLAVALLWYWPFGKTDQTAANTQPNQVTTSQPVIVRDTVEQLRVDTVIQYRTRLVRQVDTVYLPAQLPIAQTTRPDSTQFGSRSLANSANWQALTVRGAGELIRGR